MSSVIMYAPHDPKRKIDDDAVDPLPNDPEPMDDLQFAAQYAIHIPMNSPQTSPEHSNTIAVPFYQIKQDSNEDDDDESDVDLTEALREMEDDEDECEMEPHMKKTSSRSDQRGKKEVQIQSQGTPAFVPLVTQHEVDIFTCPVTDLQNQLDFNLQVDQHELPMALLTDTITTIDDSSSPHVIASSVLISVCSFIL
jgi:hypothetical protein